MPRRRRPSDPKPPKPFDPVRGQQRRVIVQSKIAGFEERLRACGMHIKSFCMRFGVPRSSWYRWRNGENTMSVADVEFVDDRVTFVEQEYRRRIRTLDVKRSTAREYKKQADDLGLGDVLLGDFKDADKIVLSPDDPILETHYNDEKRMWAERHEKMDKLMKEGKTKQEAWHKVHYSIWHDIKRNRKAKATRRAKTRKAVDKVASEDIDIRDLLGIEYDK